MDLGQEFSIYTIIIIILAKFLPVFGVLRRRLREVRRLRVISNDGKSPTQPDPDPVLAHQVCKAVTGLSQPAKVLYSAKRQNPEQNVIWECTYVLRRLILVISACFRPPSPPSTVATARRLRYRLFIFLFIFCHVCCSSYPQVRE